MRIFAVLLCMGAFSFAQTRDYLTPDEIDQLRIEQEPNLRLKLYTKFALQRVDEIEQLVATPRTGRAAFIHDLLEDYEKIVEAMDTVADDALARKITLDKGVATATSAEKDFLARLEKIRDSKPNDLPRFEFALREAIDSTEDSIEQGQQDLGQRAAEILAKEKKEKAERAASMTPAEAAERKAEAKKIDTTPKRKPPTLLRPGEKLPSDTSKDSSKNN